MRQISEAVWELEQEGKMRVPGRIYGTQPIVEQMKRDRSFLQIRNVATLPGILKQAMVMPDGHEGYGFPIGGVAAFSLDGGIISPGGVGYDINCGVRLMTTPLTKADILAKRKELIDALFRNVPSGVGSKGKIRLERKELEDAVVRGVDWAIEHGWGTKHDAEHCEESGRMEGADPSAVSDMAKKRGLPQFGTVGAGNHFLEIDEITEIRDEAVARKFGLEKGKVAVMIHCGSRGFGHQVCDDSIKDMLAASQKYKIDLPDRELCCAPLGTPEAEKYMKGMKCAVNYAFNNRHIMGHWVRETFDQIFGKGTGEQMKLVYDVCHNIAKIEEHEVDGKRTKVCVHRKGATRAFAAGCPEIPSAYRDVGQPVIIPGSMGTASFVLVGKQWAMENTFGSTCHGSGRVMSRTQAINTINGKQLQEKLLSDGIMVKSTEFELLAEEAPAAYKNVDDVVASVEKAGISGIVAKLVPIGVVKG
jgi:tRNA-splicing ligase RtcB